MLLHVKNGDSVEARHQGTVERPHRGYEGRPLARLEQHRNHGVDGRLLRPHVIPRAGNVGGLAAKVEGLLVAGGQRLIPAVLQHVELVAEPTLIELHGIDRANADLDAGALEVALIGQCDPLLIARRHQDFEGERRLGRTLPQHGSIEFVAGFRQQFERTAQRRAIAPRSVGDGQAVAAVENIRPDALSERFQELTLAIVGRTGIGGQFGSCEEACRASIESEKIIAVDPLEIEQQR